MKTQTWFAFMCVQGMKTKEGLIYAEGQIYYFKILNEFFMQYFKPIMDGEHQKSVEVQV